MIPQLYNSKLNGLIWLAGSVLCLLSGLILVSLGLLSGIWLWSVRKGMLLCRWIKLGNNTIGIKLENTRIKIRISKLILLVNGLNQAILKKKIMCINKPNLLLSKYRNSSLKKLVISLLCKLHMQVNYELESKVSFMSKIVAG